MNFIHNAKSISPAALTLSSLARFSHHACATMLIALCLITTSPVQADSIETKTRIDLQMGLKNYIEGRTTDNVYEHFNFESGKIEPLVLKNLHPVIFAGSVRNVDRAGHGCAYYPPVSVKTPIQKGTLCP